MNRLFNFIWSNTKERWIVVSEKVTGNGKVPSSPLRCLAVLASMFASGGPVYALDPASLPVGGQITAGIATIATTGTRMTVNQFSQKMIANWQSFNIGENASVHFNQPNSVAASLNRINDQNPSQIMGSLSANGQVFLLNQAGIIFGKTATVNVGGLVASSLNMFDSDFLAAKYRFTNEGSAGSILNQGIIAIADGGVVALMAPRVTNAGSITANSGNALFAAADQVSLDFKGDGLISYTVDRGAVDALVENKGLIKADGGVVVMTAKAADALRMATASNTGVIEARTIQKKGGRIMLVSDMDTGKTTVNGTLDASAPYGGNGGFIETSGRELTVFDGATITTLAPFGNAGTWLIDPVDFTVSAGSGAQTVNGIGATTLSNSLSTTNVTIATDPSTDGNGDILVNSPVNISFQTLSLLADGAVTINAGISGTGGSGQLVLQSGTNGAVNKAVTINSPISLGGGKLKITSTGGVQSHAKIEAYGLLELYGTGDFNLDYKGDIADPRDISDFDDFTANVVGSINLYENKDHIYITPEGVTATGDITLRVKDRFTVNGPISITGSGNLALKISGTSTAVYNYISVTSPITLNSGSVSFVTEAGTGAYTIASAITATGAGLVFDQPLTLSGSPSISCNGLLTFGSPITPAASSNIILQASDFLFTGNVTGNGTQQITLKPYSVSSNMTIGTGGNIDTALSQITGFSSVTFGSADGTGKVTFGGLLPETPRSFTSSIILQAGGTGGSVIIDKAMSTTGAQLTFNAGGLLSINQSAGTQTGAVSLTGDAITLADTKSVFSSSGGAITISANTLTLSGTATLSSAGSLAITPATSGMTIGLAGGSGTLALPSGYFSSNFARGFSDITLGNATAGNVTIGGNITLRDNFSLISGGSITVNGALTGGANTITLTAAGDISISGNITNTNTTSSAIRINSTGGNIVISNPAPTITTGEGGFATLYTGTVSGSTNLTSLSGLSPGSGRFRYSSTATSTHYTSSLTAGLNAVYREQPSLEVKAESQTITYGDVTPTFTPTMVTGYKNGDTFSGTTVTGTATWLINGNTPATLYSAGSYDVTYSSGLASSLGYGFTDNISISKELTVSQRPITITAEPKVKTYGDLDPVLTCTIEPPGSGRGLVSGDLFTGSLSRASGETVQGGPYAINLGTVGNSNYSINYMASNLTVNARPITLSATAGSKVYGAADPSLSVSVSSGTLGSATVNDALSDVTGMLSRQAGSTVGTYDIALGNGSKASNYLITFTSDNNVFSITPKTVRLSASKSYDGTTGLAGAVTVVTGVGSETLTYTNAFASDANVATANKFISSITLADGSGQAGNYQLPVLGSVAAPVTISPKTVTLSANKTYDSTKELTGAVTIETGVGSETLSYSHAAASDANVATANKFISTITLADGTHGGVASNYQLPKLSVATAPVIITPKVVTLSAKKNYDGTTSLEGAVTIVTGVGSETLTYTNAQATDANAATVNTFISTITLADGSGLASNYQLPALNSSNVPVIIKPLPMAATTVPLAVTVPLEVTAIKQSAPDGAANSSAPQTSAGTVNGESSSTTATTGAAESSSATTSTAGSGESPAASSSTTTAAAGEGSPASTATTAGTPSGTGSKAGLNAAANRARMAAGSAKPGLQGAMSGSGLNFRPPDQVMDNAIAAGSFAANSLTTGTSFTESSIAEVVSSPDKVSFSSGTPVSGRQPRNGVSKKTKKTNRSDAPPDPIAFGTFGTLGYLTIYLFSMYKKS